MDRRVLLAKTGRAARLGAQASVQLAADARTRWRARQLGTDPDATAHRIIDVPAHHVRLDDLPPEVASQLDYDDAAPPAIRHMRVPPEVAAALRDLWNGVIGDLYDEIRLLAQDRRLTREKAERVAGRVVTRIEQAERTMVLAGTVQPLAGDDARQLARSAAIGVGSATAAAAVATYASFAVGTAVGAAAVIVSEAFETYVAASARSHQYRAAGRTPDPDVIALDMAAALGDKKSFGLPADGDMARTAMVWLAKKLVEKTVKRLLRTLVPVVGVAVNAGSAHRTVMRVTELPLRPPAPGEGSHPALLGEIWPMPTVADDATPPRLRKRG